MAAPSTNYAEVTAAMVNIHEPNYAAFYTSFGADVAQLANAALRDSVVGASNAYPKVFVRVAGNPPMISCILCPTRFTAPMGVVSPWANRIFCLNGDISQHGHPSVVDWPIDAFARCAVAHVPTAAEVDFVWMADLAAKSCGPFLAQAPDTEDIQCRYLCPLPVKYATIALRKPWCLPRTFWHKVVHAVQADGNDVACAEFMKWARMACTLRTQAGGDIISNLSPDLVAPVADGDLLDFVSSWIRADIPDRAPVASAMGVQQQLIAQQHQLTTLLANQQAAATTAALPGVKTVAEVYPAFIGSLLKYCHVDREDQLPPVYCRMANSKRQEQVAVIEYALAARADEVGWAPPVASPEVVQIIFKMQFTAPDLDDITAGLLVFLMVGSNEFKAGGV